MLHKRQGSQSEHKNIAKVLFLLAAVLLVPAPAVLAQSGTAQSGTDSPEDTTEQPYTSSEIAAAKAAVRYDAAGNPIELSDDEFNALPRRIREIITTVTSESVTLTLTASTSNLARSARLTRSARWSWNWEGWRRGCQDITRTRVGKNILGVQLVEAKTRLLEVCSNGSGQIDPEPVVVRSQSASWGWTECGWRAAYQVSRNGGRRYEVGGLARFSLTIPGIANLCDAVDKTLSNHILATVWTSGDWVGHWIWRP